MTEIQRAARSGAGRCRRIGLAGAMTALAVSGIVMTGAGSAAAATPRATPTTTAAASAAGVALSRKLGPYVLSRCLREGNQGMEDGAWDDYECKGTSGHYYIHPVHKRRGGHH